MQIGFWTEFMMAFVVAILCSGALVGILDWEHPDHPGSVAAFFFSFLILLVVVWAGGIWLKPIGPLLWGVAWMPFIIVGLLMSVTMIVLVPPGRTEPGANSKDGTDAKVGAAKRFSAFFWLLLVLLAAGIFFRYIM